MPLTKSKNIIDEANILSRYASDMDNSRRFYTMVEKSEDADEKDISIKFVSPKFHIWEEYRFTLLKDAVRKPLESKDYYRPDYVAYNEYSNINFWALILFINDIPTIEDFNVESIIIPSYSCVRDVVQAVSDKQPVQEFVALYELPPTPTIPLYSKKKMVAAGTVDIVEQVEFTPTNMYFARESFTLTLFDIRNRYIELIQEPVDASVNLIISDSSNYIKGRHYDIIQGTKGKNRLTWNPRLISNGIGLPTLSIVVAWLLQKERYLLELSLFE
jgi:hypothetical protein